MLGGFKEKAPRLLIRAEFDSASACEELPCGAYRTFVVLTFSEVEPVFTAACTLKPTEAEELERFVLRDRLRGSSHVAATYQGT